MTEIEIPDEAIIEANRAAEAAGATVPAAVLRAVLAAALPSLAAAERARLYSAVQYSIGRIREELTRETA